MIAPISRRPELRQLFLFALLLLPCGFLASCRQDPSETFDDARRAVRSWSATLVMTIRQWDARQVPARYVRQAIDAGRKALAEQKKELAKVADEARRAGLEGEIAQVEKRMSDLSDAVRRDDRAGALKVVDALRVDLNLTAPAPGSERGAGS